MEPNLAEVEPEEAKKEDKSYKPLLLFAGNIDFTKNRSEQSYQSLKFERRFKFTQIRLVNQRTVISDHITLEKIQNDYIE